ncbi:MAG: Eco57I restriction-modification methylase domain-containing protein, partial [Candidatus Hodarchaeales archaeon]
MTEIVRARSVLTPYLTNQRNRDPYNFKWHCIENSLYGVDIDASAVEIAKLRLWLSLVVDEESYDQIRPLPNLDYRIVCGNSLLSVEKNLFNYTLYPELEKKKSQYFGTTSQKNKAVLRNEIEEIINQLTDGKRLFDFEIYFSEVFSKKKGFDVVIGNPPYLEARSKEFKQEIKNKLQDNVKKLVGKQSQYIPRGSDLLIYFFFVSLRLVNEKGFVVKITQNSWLDTEYGRKFQKYLLLNTYVKYIVDSDFKYFDTANINTIITIFQGNKPCPENYTVFIRYKVSYSDLGLFTAINLDDSTYAEIKRIGSDAEILESLKWGTIHISDNRTFQLIQKLDQKGIKVSKVGEAMLSIGQGLNLQKKYVISNKDIKKYDLKKSYLIPFITTTDAASFKIISTEKYLINGAQIPEDAKKRLVNDGVGIFSPSSTTKPSPVLIMPRGIGERHYCSINQTQGYSDSGVDVYSKASKLDDKILINLWAFFNSSIFWLIREITGRKNLGGGMLKAEAVDIRYYPVYFELSQLDEIKQILNEISKRKPLPVAEETFTKEHKRIDKIIFDFLEISQNTRQRVVQNLLYMVDSRRKKSRT